MSFRSRSDYHASLTTQHIVTFLHQEYHQISQIIIEEIQVEDHGRGRGRGRLRDQGLYGAGTFVYPAREAHRPGARSRHVRRTVYIPKELPLSLSPRKGYCFNILRVLYPRVECPGSAPPRSNGSPLYIQFFFQYHMYIWKILLSHEYTVKRNYKAYQCTATLIINNYSI